MRGSPLLSALLAFVVIGLLGWPLWRLTHPTIVAAPRPIESAPEAAEDTVRFELAFTLPPKSVTIDHLGKLLWSVNDPGLEIERDAKLAWPTEGIDLRVRITWPEDAPLAAARMRVIDPRGMKHENSIFARGAADEVLTFE